MSEQVSAAAPVVQAPPSLDSDVRVFISHDMENAGSFALRLVSDLEALGATCWTASRDIPAGEQWITAINEAFVRSTHILALVGRNKPSRWVRHETAMGLERQIREEGFEVIPVVFEEGAQLTDGLQVSQGVDIVTDYADGLQRLAARLGLEEALPTHEGRLIVAWEQGLARLRRQSEPLRRQLAAVRQAVETERGNSEQRAADAEAAVAAAKSARARAAKLEGQARAATTQADMAEEAASQAMAALQRTETVVAELSRRLVELEASHSPILNLVEQAEELLRTAQRHGALNVDRSDEVVTLLQDPGQAPTPLEIREANSLSDFLHRHQITEVMLTVIQRRMPEDSPERDFVFSRCMQALASEVPPALELSRHWDNSDLRELESGVDEAIRQYLAIKNNQADSVAWFEGNLGVAFVRYVTKNAKASDDITDHGRSSPTIPPKSPDSAVFDVVITGLAGNFRSWSASSLADAIHQLTKRYPDRATLHGFFEAQSTVLKHRFPSTVLEKVNEETATDAAAQLRSRGGEVAVRQTEDGS